MDRAYESHAVAQAPAVPEAMSKGYPTGGNPMTGQRATRPGPWWYHMITEELLQVIEAAKLNPDAKSTTQVIGALQTLFAARPAHESLAQAFTEHVQGVDPHSQYMTQAETDGLIRSFFVSEEDTPPGQGDWNGIAATQPGVGRAMLTGGAAHGPEAGRNAQYHVLNFGFAANDGSGDCTQLAIPFAAPCDEIYFRGRLQGVWTPWRRLWTSINFDPREIDAPVGSILWVPYASPPPKHLKANGARLSRNLYAQLFAKIGTTYGAGDGVTTFDLIDLRGEFPRGWDDGRGVDAGRVLGSAQGDAIRNLRGNFSAGSISGFPVDTLVDGPFEIGEVEYGQKIGAVSGAGKSLLFNASRTVPTASENRPRNVALLACIKYC